jgi:hypothetical protein
MSIDLILDRIEYNMGGFFFLKFFIQKIIWKFQILAKLDKFTLGKKFQFIGI